MNRKVLSKSKRVQESGIALLTTILLLFLMSSLLVGFAVLLISNQQLAGASNDQTVAFYAAEAGMEKMTADLAGLFSQTYSPSTTQITALETTPNGPPVSSIFPGEVVTYTTADGSTGYTITPQDLDSNGNPAAVNTTIKSGPYQGMNALATTYDLTVNARTSSGREVTLTRTAQTVGIPMFQFAIFCDVDCSFHAGSNYTVNGRVHGNGNLFLASGATLTLEGKVDAYKDIIRAYMDNGVNTQASWAGNVSITTTPTGGSYRNLAFTEGSATNAGTAGTCISTWDQVSTGSSPTDYASNLINGKGSTNCATASTGAQQLNLAVVTMGGGTTQPVDLIRRPKLGESSNVTGERYIAQSSLVILLSDNPADITSLPCMDATPPIDLSVLAQSNWWSNPNVLNIPNSQYQKLYNLMYQYGTIPLPLAASGAAPNATGYNAADGYWLPSGYPIVKGYIKIEAQTSYGAPCGTWQDVTAEILALGYAGGNINPVPQTLTGTQLNAEWSGVNGSYGGSGAATSPCVGQTTSCTQMDPLRGAGTGYVIPTASASTSTAYSAISAKQVQMTLCTAGASGCPASFSTSWPGYPLPNPPSAQVGPQNQIASTPVLGAGTFSNTSNGRCLDPHPNAIIRLERIRDNPSTLYTGNPSNANKPYVASGPFSTTAIKQVPVAIACGMDPATKKLPLVYDQAGNQGVWTPQPWDFWNNEVFDPREGELRDAIPSGNYANLPTLNGGMHYIELDVKNLALWFAGTIGSSGHLTYDSVNSPNDFSVYISDRRGNYAAPSTVNFTTWPPTSPTGYETGEYGWNDIVNSTDVTNGCPNNSLDTGEDFDGISTLLTYGANSANIKYIMDPGDTMANLYIMNGSTNTGTKSPTGGINNTGAFGEYGFYGTLIGAVGTGAIYANPNCAAPSYASPSPGIWPMMYASQSNALRENPPIFFRRALKIADANNLTALGTCPSGIVCGLSIATENPVYLQGDYNSDYGTPGTSGFTDASVGSSIAGDSVAILSNSWNDVNSFSYAIYANGSNARTPTTTYWRAAIVAGKGVSFPNFGSSTDTGTDGGMHNFLRELENWGATSATVNYEGALVNLFTDRQSNGFFKYGSTVYTVPNRYTTFDSNFLTPSELPPRTPMFREVNTTGWTRIMAPNASNYK